ncbi:hypothetical protein D0Z67_25065 [Streptomyces seoulensis]|uniref:Exo-alpha-sialidase n=1 Tax=Streptomyces seoulensis TaxID=73044 RepID=A0A4P6U219_STRSO|nr:hypothetical protein [Streptomyces seoulensis]QBJ93232.1 hypothetical protein D0Z67_25065 [Streptomyces seoulensis]
MLSTTSSRRLWRLLCLLCAGTLLSACQGGEGDDRPGPPAVAARWRQIPLTELPSEFFALSATSLVPSKDGFLLAARSQAGGSELFRSVDGISWRRSRPQARQLEVDVLAEHGGEVLAAGRTFRDGEMTAAVTRYRGAGRWGKEEVLPGGGSSDIVLAAARGPRGAVVVGHDGGPFDASTGKRGHSLRVWAAKNGGPFGAPHGVTCPQWPDQPPEVGAFADADGFTVRARCRGAEGESASFTLRSSDGRTWRREKDSPGPVALRAGAANPRGGARVGQVVTLPGGYLALGSAESATRSTGALWSSSDGRRWSAVTGGKDGFRQSVSVDAAAEYDGTLLALGTDPEPDGHPPVRMRVWLGTPPGGTPKPIPDKGQGLRAVSGTWSWAQATLKISGEGDFTYRYRVLRDCATEAPPCDDTSTSTWGGLVTGTLADGSHGTLRGKVDSANATDRSYTKGASVTVAREPYSAVSLTIGTTLVGILCRPGSGDERCDDVHE